MFLEPLRAGEVALPVDGVPEPFVDAEDSHERTFSPDRQADSPPDARRNSMSRDSGTEVRIHVDFPK